MEGTDNLRNADGAYHAASSQTHGHTKSVQGAFAGSSRFDPAVLRFLVCPLTKGDLRYDAGKQELISEEIQVAYPIIDGIARLVPTAGRMMEAAEFPAS
ncbi:MAG: mitochondrial [Trebouxia sp. A1-2]|nr:MAG: mitochondrial [Trebouxia sp. A1-2]